MLRSAAKMERNLAPPRGSEPFRNNSQTRPHPHNEICFVRAADLAAMNREKKLFTGEVMEAHLRQIERVNPRVNAIVTLVDENQLMAQAQAADQATVRGERLGPLHGLPVGVKDNHQTDGIGTTWGSM